MRRIYVRAPLVVGLSLSGLTRRKTAPPGGAPGANVANAAQAAAQQQPSAPRIGTASPAPQLRLKACRFSPVESI
jgi:hypothetical protein